MDRRGFIKSVGALSLAAPIGDFAVAQPTGDPFDPTEQSVVALQQSLGSGAVTSEALTSAYLARIARYDQAGPTRRRHNSRGGFVLQSASIRTPVWMPSWSAPRPSKAVRLGH